MTDAPSEAPEKSAPQRDSPRAPVSFDALLELDEGPAVRVNVVDISESGARLTGPLEKAAGDGELQLDSGLAVRCTVVRPGADSCGLRFGKLNEKQRAALRQLLAGLVRSFEEEAVLTPRGPVELSAEGLLSGEMYERFGLSPRCSDEELAARGREVLAAVEAGISKAQGERKRRLVAVRKSFALLKPTWTDAEARASYDKHAGLDDEDDRPLRGVQGHLADISAADLLAALAEGERDAELQLSEGGADRAVVAVEKGACVGAFAGELEGEEALERAAAFKSGLFYVNYAAPRDALRNLEGGTAEALKAAADAGRDAEQAALKPLPEGARIEAPRRDEHGAARKRSEPAPVPTAAKPKPAPTPNDAPPPVAPLEASSSTHGAVVVGVAVLLLAVLIALVVLSAR